MPYDRLVSAGAQHTVSVANRTKNISQSRTLRDEKQSNLISLTQLYWENYERTKAQKMLVFTISGIHILRLWKSVLRVQHCTGSSFHDYQTKKALLPRHASEGFEAVHWEFTSPLQGYRMGDILTVPLVAFLELAVLGGISAGREISMTMRRALQRSLFSSVHFFLS